MAPQESDGDRGAGTSSGSIDSSQPNPTSTSTNEHGGPARGAPNTQHSVPYTVNQEGHHLQVDFISGPQQGDSFRLNMQDIAAARQRWQARADSNDPPEEELPLHSYHGPDGRQISEEEYRQNVAAELAHDQRKKAEKKASSKSGSRKPK